MRRARGLVVGLALLGAGCASRGAPAAAGAGAPVTARLNADIIYPDEIAGSRAVDAYDAIVRLRPRFLAPRGTGGSRRPEGVQVVLDGRTLGSYTELRQVPAGSIVYIRYLSALEASTNWGGRFDAPVVYVLTRAGPPPS